MLRNILIASVVSLYSAPLYGGDLTLQPNGTTNASQSAAVVVALAGGKKLATMKWLVSLKIGTTTIDVTACTLNTTGGGTGGTPTAGNSVTPYNISTGKKSVTIKVKLDDGTTQEVTADVTFN